MAAPAVQTHTNGGGTNNNSASVPLPSGITSGDRLVVIFNINNGNADTPTGWTKILDNSGADISLLMHAHVFVRDADGTEGTTLSMTWIGGNLKWTSVSYRITGADTVANIEISSRTSNGATTTIDLPSFSPSAGTKDWLWIIFYAAVGSFTTAAAPTGYTNLEARASGGTGNSNSKSSIGAATKATTATASEDPPSWTIDTSNQAALGWILAVPPVAAQVYTDAATVYLDLQASGTDEYTPAPAPDSDNLFSQPRVYMEQAIRSHWRARKF